MVKKSIDVVTYCLLSFLVMGLSHAEEKIVAEEKTEITDLRLLITGNTIDGKIVSSQTSYKMYFHPSGKLLRHISKTNEEQGDWRISNKTDLCITLAAEKCFTVKKRGDGEYDLYDHQAELALTIDKVIIGNPNRLDALSGKK